MSGPMLTTASAVESTNTDMFHRSHSSPDLLLLGTLARPPLPRSSHTFDRRDTTVPKLLFNTPPSKTLATPGTAAIATASTPNLGSFSSFSPPSTDLSLKSLPSLPAFNVPCLDFETDLDTDLEFLRKRKPRKQASPPNEPPRRVWEEFIKADNHSRSSTESVSPKPDVGASIEATINNSEADLSASAASSYIDQEDSANERPIVDSAKTSRRKALVDRPLSWIPSTRSETDFHELLIKEREKEARRAKLAAATAASTASSSPGTAKNERIAYKSKPATVLSTAVPTLPTDSDRMVERQRTVSASFVDFARRSWISRSPSPSPKSPRKSPGKKASSRDDAGRSGGRFSRRRAAAPTVLVVRSSATNDDSDNPPDTDQQPEEEQYPNRVGSAGPPPAKAEGDPIGPAATAPRATNGATPGNTTFTTMVVASASTSRTFSRASGYLSRIKQRPQSMFIKAATVTTYYSSTPGTKTSQTHDTFGSDSASGRPSHTSSASLSLSLELLSDRTVETNDAYDLMPSLTSAERASSGNGRESRNSSHSDDCSSTDGSVSGSANGSTLLPASEAESLTTAVTSNNNSPMTNPVSRDPLWVAFKDLETNFYKFLSKTTTAQRMVIVRAALIPFLRRNTVDSSIKNTPPLSPEDVERRASILDRWWTGLLEMLDGPNPWQGNSQSQGNVFGGGAFFSTSTTANRSFQPVSGIDRPVVLESVSMVMARPEWRLLTPAFRPFDDRSPDERVRTCADTSDSRPLDDSSFLVEESAEHNVRTMFINNLLAQLILVVDKMGMRQAPLSIVNFSGKACAYAMFFVPGVAEILIRLWGLDKNIELVRRAADAFSLPRRSRGESEDLVALFPPCMGSLGWSSVSAMHAKLRRPPRMNLLPPAYVAACSRVSWFAPCWLSRWRGADSDLLFIFCKYFHVLADEFMPSSLELPLVEKARAPGFVLLHAQLLQVFDNTIHRQAAVEAAMMLAGAPMGEGTPSLWLQRQMEQQQPYMMTSSDDAFVPPLMLQPNHNLFRDMGENRIIALLRDLLASDESLAGARATFAESAMVLLKAATLRTSQYDHNACYILCDFLHEILQTFDNYYGYCSRDSTSSGVSAPVDFIDWTFWLDICKKILDSNNTMSEIRVLSFVFATWDIVAADPLRKEELCIRWLLTEEVFDKFFNNWCPMVRAYYMRLLCWRMCRDPGSANELDNKIFILASKRLSTVWSHYLWLKQKADNNGLLQPSTAPSLPQPGKRFMIVRTEVTGSHLGLLANMNDSASSNAGNRRPAATTFDALATTISGIDGSGAISYENDPSSGYFLASTADSKKNESSSSKKKWSILGKVLNMTAKSASEDDFENMRREAAGGRVPHKGGTSSLLLKPTSSMRLGSSSSDSDSSTGSAPVFDASQFVFRFLLHNIPWQGQGGGQGEIVLPPAYRERVLTRPRLPAPAQARVSARLAASGKRSDSPSPPAPGLPPVTRRVSGLPTGGLINEARNASPLDEGSRGSSRSGSTSSGSRPSLGLRRASSPFTNPSERERGRSISPLVQNDSPENDFDPQRQIDRVVVQPEEPKSHTAMLRAKYSGRALAEWSMVVNECNSFVDRRRDEGIYGLKDVEVPTLTVEGMRRLV